MGSVELLLTMEEDDRSESSPQQTPASSPDRRSHRELTSPFASPEQARHPGSEEDAVIAASLLQPTVDFTSGVVEARRGGETEKSWQKTCKHFEVFFEEYCNTWLKEGIRIFGHARKAEWVYDVTKLTTQQLANLDGQVADHYAMYLATKATTRDRSKELIAYETASRYFSAWKCGINHKLFYWKGEKPLDDRTKMKAIRDGMTGLIQIRCINEQKSLSKSHVSASFEDIKIITTVCMWKNDADSANLAFFLQSLYYFSGRAYEIARLPFKRTSMHTPNDFSEGDSTCTDKLCRVDIWRTKTQHETSVTVFNHKDSFLLDFYFLQCFSMLMHTTPPSEFLYYKFYNGESAECSPDATDPESPPDESSPPPSPADHAPHATANRRPGNTAGPGPGASAAASFAKNGAKMFDRQGNKITSLFNKFMAQLYTAASELDDLFEQVNQETSGYVHSQTSGSLKFNPDLTSHSPKRMAVNYIDGLAVIKTTWAIIAHGWQLKALSTIFDYLDSRKETTNQVDKAKAGWTTSSPWPGSKLGGGRPPSLEALKSMGDTDFGFNFAVKFAHTLFDRYHTVEGADDTNLHELLAATAIMHLPKFVTLLLEHPTKQFGDTELDCVKNHDFSQSFMHAFDATCNFFGITRISRDEKYKTLVSWSDAIEVDFVERNYMFVSEEQLLRVHDSAVQEDSEHGTPQSSAEQTDGSNTAGVLSIRGFAAIRGIRSIAGFLNGFGRAFSQVNMSLHHIKKGLQSLTALFQGFAKSHNSIDERLQTIEAQNRDILALLKQANPTTHTGTPRRIGSPERVPNAPRHSEAASDPPEMEIPPQAQFRSMKHWKVRDLFVSWIVDELYRYPVEPVYRQNRNVAKFCVEYLTIFLPEQVPALPQGAMIGTPEHRAHCARVRQLANDAWDNYTDFYRRETNKSDAKPGESTSNFKKYMSESDPNKWPLGPSIESPFQPPGDPMKDRQALASNIQSILEKRKSKEASGTGPRKKRKTPKVADGARSVANENAQPNETTTP